MSKIGEIFEPRVKWVDDSGVEHNGTIIGPGLTTAHKLVKDSKGQVWTCHGCLLKEVS
jgi:hypothetical protein